ADRERQARQAVQAAYDALAGARAEQTRLAQLAAERQSRLAALDEGAKALASDQAETEAAMAAAQSDIAALPDFASLRAELAALPWQPAEQRRRLVECRSRRERLLQDAQARRRRLEAVAGERQSWQTRATAAATRLAEFAERRSAAEAERDRLAQRPRE